MQLLVRVQSQIQSRRIQMLENQALQRQSQYKNDKELESSIGKWASSQPVSFPMFDLVLDCFSLLEEHMLKDHLIAIVKGKTLIYMKSCLFFDFVLCFN